MVAKQCDAELKGSNYRHATFVDLFCYICIDYWLLIIDWLEHLDCNVGDWWLANNFWFFFSISMLIVFFFGVQFSIIADKSTFGFHRHVSFYVKKSTYIIFEL